MSEKQSLQGFIDGLLEDTPKNEWVVVELTIRKTGDDSWEVASGEDFGPHILKPKVIPE